MILTRMFDLFVFVLYLKVNHIALLPEWWRTGWFISRWFAASELSPECALGRWSLQGSELQCCSMHFPADNSSNSNTRNETDFI